ncbi:MAG: DUF4962 domain-containing protein, partial [Fidelibacterota bacterium]
MVMDYARASFLLVDVYAGDLMMNRSFYNGFACLLIFLALSVRADGATRIEFPSSRPENGSFNRPSQGEILDISPPGFCWWRAGEKDKVLYRLSILRPTGEYVYESPLLRDPVHVPPEVLPPGQYTWIVEAIVDGDRVVATRSPQTFEIAEDPIPLPWISVEKLLDRVPKEHPRLLFPKSELQAIRATLGTTRKDAFTGLKHVADDALDLPLMDEPDFDKYDRVTEYPMRRTAYRAAYHEFTSRYHRGMTPLALMYLLTGEKRYGEAAKAHLLNLLDWDSDGIASLESSFDEIGLRIDRTIAQAYDWLYDLLTEEERAAVKGMLIVHGNNMLARLRERDFLNFAAYSHDGRLPGYLVEFSIALAEEPVAREWMEYALQTLMTVFPHWAGKDGGWAEGISYSLSYNDRFITPLQSLYMATGLDLWQRPFFRKFRYFLMYNTAPGGEILPFGDGEQKEPGDWQESMVSILNFHAVRYNDPVLRGWLNSFSLDDSNPDRLDAMLRLILPDTLIPVPPTELPLDRAFWGIGWAAMHTDLANPAEDLMVLFKSSPYGAVSHSHADQNSFLIMKGGKTLAMPGGIRYPQHGSPFHEEYTQQSIAHNVLLINGKGQINRDETANGELVRFESLPHVGYVAGQARKCYGEPVESYIRHVALIRPSLILVVDDIETKKPVKIDWLMHAREKLILDEEAQQFISPRHDEAMTARLFAVEPLNFSQTDAWPVEPKKDYPMVTAPEPARQWHFTARAKGRKKRWRNAAVMTVGDGDRMTNN